MKANKGMIMSKLLKNILVVALSVAFSSTAFAAGSGSSPKGKPFIAIGDQIVEVEGAINSLQDQVDILVGRVDSIEARVFANEGAITTLQNQNAALTTLVQQNLSDIASIDAEILALQQANADLAAMIAANSGDIATLQSDVAANDALITTLQSAILMVQGDIISLETSLQSQIDNNLMLIGVIQGELDTINAKLALKQNLINGICPDGSAIQQVLTDGSVICEGVAGASGQLESVVSINWRFAEPGHDTRLLTYCPDGYTATGSGFAHALGWEIQHHFAQGNVADIRARNDNPFSDDIHGVATCTRIAP